MLRTNPWKAKKCHNLPDAFEEGERVTVRPKGLPGVVQSLPSSQDPLFTILLDTGEVVKADWFIVDHDRMHA